MKQWLRKNKKYSYLAVFFLVVIFLAVALFDFSKILTINETKRGYNEISRSARYHSLIVQNQINRYFAQLEKGVVLLREKNLSDDENLQLVEQYMEMLGTEFQSLGIANRNGRMMLSTGEIVQVEGTPFFDMALSGHHYLSSREQEDGVHAIMTARIQDVAGNIRGVLCGEILLENMRLFEQALEENQPEHLCLVDGEGQFILKYEMPYRVESLSDALGVCVFEPENEEIVNREQVFEGMKERKTMLFSVKHKNEPKIVTMTPIADSDWYLYEVSDRQIIDQEIKYYQKDMFFLTFKVLGMFGILSAIYLHFSIKEREKIEKLYKELALNEEAYRVTVEQSNQCIFTYDSKNHEIHFLNDKYREFGLEEQWTDMVSLLKLLKNNNSAAYHRAAQIAASVPHNVPKAERELFVKIHGQNRFLRVCMVNLFGTDKQVVRSIGIVEDITEHKENLMQVRREQAFRKSLLSDCLGYLEVNVNEDMVVENSYESGKRGMMRGSYTQLIHFYIDKKVVPKYREELKLKMSRETMMVCCQREIYDMFLEYETIESDGKVYWTACDIRMKWLEDKGEITAYLVFRNIDERKREQMRLRREAMLDELTGALKRHVAIERINYVIQKPLSENWCHVFMILDMDNFKTLNDTLGHMYGDQALKDLVAVARENCRREDIICRLGGDEFIIFLNKVARNVVTKRIEAFQQSLRATYERDGVTVEVSASIGVALMPDHGASFDELYAMADEALYRVKTSEKGTYYVMQ